jgi:hypothetical protein
MESTQMKMFIPLRKIDAKQRTVYGTAVSEIADRSNEIFDYASSKPYFKAWSENALKISGGKSIGNVRGMHSNIAVGKLTSISYDDDRKAIKISAKIIDDTEWRKVEEGVYTGFSIGGRYLKRWDDGDLKRYTADPSEISLVDLPCVPSATFSMIKADGSEVLRKFKPRAGVPSDDDLRKRGLVAQLRHGPGVGEPVAGFDATRASNDGQSVQFSIGLNDEKIPVKYGDRVIVVAGVELPIDELPTEVRRELEAAMARLDGASFDVDANLLGVAEARRAIEWAIFGVMSSKPYRDRLITAGTRRVKQEEKT